MSKLVRTSVKNAFRIKSSGFAAALTKKNGVASRPMRERVITALATDDCPITSIQFKHLDGHWYVFVGSSYTDRPKPKAKPVAAVEYSYPLTLDDYHAAAECNSVPDTNGEYI